MSDSIVDTKLSKMTHRERFRRVMHFQTVDRGVHWEFGYTAETIQRWHTEGLDPRYDDIAKIEAYFGVDPRETVPTNVGLVPAFEGEAKVLKEEGNHRITQYPDGAINEEVIEGLRTIPHFIKMPVENRDDWKRFKERLDPASPDRWRNDFREIGERLRHSDKPVVIELGSYFGVPRSWMGFERIAMMVYDDRPLIEDIVATLTEVYYTQLEAALPHVEVDLAGGWEDMCFRNGPIISPGMFKEIVVPHLKRVCDLLRQHGCDVIWTDCDGNINDLVPLWLDAGLNCMFPVEMQGGSDVVALREKYGKRILLAGGLAKYQFAFGKKEILAELKRVEKVVEEGGYIPHGDHRIPDDVPYDNYRYYIREKLAMLGWAKEEIQAIEPLRDVPDIG